MKYPRIRLLVFARAPRAGRTKTRLIPALGAVGAARLHARLVRRMVTLAAGAGLCPLELWVDGDPAHPLFRELAAGFPLTLHRQRGAGLGERMAHAFRDALGRADAALLAGCDCPGLDGRVLTKSLERLEGADAVLQPVLDGGYSLLGLKRLDPSLFTAMPWGTETVARRTRERLAALGWRWEELPPLWDLDRPEDLARLRQLDPGLLSEAPPAEAANVAPGE